MSVQFGHHTNTRIHGRDITAWISPAEITRRIAQVESSLIVGETHVIVARLPRTVRAADGSTGNMIVVPVQYDGRGQMFCKTIMFRNSHQRQTRHTVDASR